MNVYNSCFVYFSNLNVIRIDTNVQNVSKRHTPLRMSIKKNYLNAVRFRSLPVLFGAFETFCIDEYLEAIIPIFYETILKIVLC